MIIFLNGKYKEATPKEIESLRPGVLNATGVFETMRVIDGSVVFLEQHFKRFKSGVSVFKLPVSYDLYAIETKLNQVIKRNTINNGRIRLATWISDKRICSAIVVAEIKPIGKGFKATIVSTIRNPTYYSHVKSLRYALFYNALKEAQKKGFDEAILCNDQGFVVEGATSNIFAIKKECVLTSPVSAGCLNGITRQKVIQVARRKGFKVKVENITPAQLKRCDEIFITNAVVGIMPIVNIDGVVKGMSFNNTTQILRNAYNQELKVAVV
ncbi:MAG: branched-chain amino acid aminotransferase [Lysobacterales bacterium]|jgi:branched-chain amino acid aminotransferase